VVRTLSTTNGKPVDSSRLGRAREAFAEVFPATLARFIALADTASPEGTTGHAHGWTVDCMMS